MDKATLLTKLAQVRRRAEAAHLEIVIHSALVTRLEKEGRDTSAARVQLNNWKMKEQRLLLEMNWVLDDLDEAET